MFGWKELKAAIITIFLVIIAIIIIGTGYLYSDQTDNVKQQSIPEVSEEQTQETVEKVINETAEKEEPKLPDDHDIYEANIFFFSSDCVFKYDKGIDDVNDLKSFIAKTEGRIEVAENTGNETGLDYLYEKLADARQLLQQKTEEIRSLITECRTE